MELWLDIRGNQPIELPSGIDRVVCNEPQPSTEHIVIRNDEPSFSNAEQGVCIHIDSNESQTTALSYVGIVDWILLSGGEWTMIPFENLVAACQHSHTKIASFITIPEQAIGAAFALDTGVDALIVTPEEALVQSAQVAKSSRLERLPTPEKIVEIRSTEHLDLMTVTSVESGGTGDRYCLDFTSLFENDEGVLIGSSAKTLVLVKAETTPSEFVPPRPFRVNSGSPHSYIQMIDGTLKYISELQTGDAIATYSVHGAIRESILGRRKIEHRPFLLIKVKDRKNNDGHIFLQQAETVRLVSDKGEPISITQLKIGDSILGKASNHGTHIGNTVLGTVEEN